MCRLSVNLIKKTADLNWRSLQRERERAATLYLAFQVSCERTAKELAKEKIKEGHKCFDLKWQKDYPVKVKPLCVPSASVERLPNN